MGRRKTQGDRIAEQLTRDLEPNSEWDERERLVLAKIKDAVDRAEVLRGLLDAELAAAEPAVRRVCDLSSEIRLTDSSVLRWAAQLDPHAEQVKSAQHVHAANVRWNRHRGQAG